MNLFRRLKELWTREGMQGIIKLFRLRLFYILFVYKPAHVRAVRNDRQAAMKNYHAWFLDQLPDAAERAHQHAAEFHHTLSFLIPTYNTDPVMLKDLVDSLLDQTTDAWEACFYDGSSTKPETLAALREAAARDPRIRVTFGTENLGISGNTNRCLDMARGDWSALVDHDDLITPDAAYCVLYAAEKGADFVYSDEDKCNADGTFFYDPHVKSDFAPDSLRAGNYICHLMAMKTELMRRVGGLRSEFDGSQDHDLALRATEQAKRIVHIPRVLYHWRQVSTSASHQGAERCALAAAKAVNEQCIRLGLPERAYMKNLRVELEPHLSPSTITLIITCRERGNLSWLKGFLRSAGMPVDHIIFVGWDGPDTFQGIPCQSLKISGTLSDTLNRAAEMTEDDVLLFANKGLLVMIHTWLPHMLKYSQRPNIACVGSALLSYVQNYYHCGYAVDVPGGAISHHNDVNSVTIPYQLTDRTNRNVTAVSRHLLMIRRSVFVELGGFGRYESDLMSVALGLKAMEKGYLNMFVTDARMQWSGGKDHLPCLTKPAPDDELNRFRKEFGEHPKEKYYSPLFEKEKGYMIIDFSRPMPKMEEIL